MAQQIVPLAACVMPAQLEATRFGRPLHKALGKNSGA
jgi:hypothetical protein